MKKKVLISVLAGLSSTLAFSPLTLAHDHNTNHQQAGFHLYSPDVASDGEIDSSFEYDGFGCSGANQSPELHWDNVPAGTRSFAISVHDPDAPTGSGWWHWRVINLPADTTSLDGNAGAVGGDNLPANAMQIRNDYGDKGWGGLCPPEGAGPHSYHFTVHALDVESIDLPEDASAALAGYMINQHEIARAGFVAIYSRDAN